MRGAPCFALRFLGTRPSGAYAISTHFSRPPCAPLVVRTRRRTLLAIEFALEHFGVLRYSSTRQLVLTVPVAIGVGRLLARYLDDQGDALFWIVVWGYAVVMFGAAVVGHRRTRTGTASGT